MLSAVFFGIYFASFVPSLIIAFIPRRFGQPPDPGIVAAEVGLEVLAGLAAIILLWRPASSRFFSAAKEARAARMQATPPLSRRKRTPSSCVRPQ